MPIFASDTGPTLPQRRAAVARAEHLAQRTGDRSQAVARRRELAEAKLADYIQRTIDEAPPLTVEQRDRLATLLRGDAA